MEHAAINGPAARGLSAGAAETVSRSGGRGVNASRVQLGAVRSTPRHAARAPIGWRHGDDLARGRRRPGSNNTDRVGSQTNPCRKPNQSRFTGRSRLPAQQAWNEPCRHRPRASFGTRGFGRSAAETVSRSGGRGVNASRVQLGAVRSTPRHAARAPIGWRHGGDTTRAGNRPGSENQDRVGSPADPCRKPNQSRFTGRSRLPAQQAWIEPCRHRPRASFGTRGFGRSAAETVSRSGGRGVNASRVQLGAVRSTPRHAARAPIGWRHGDDLARGRRRPGSNNTDRVGSQTNPCRKPNQKWGALRDSNPRPPVPQCERSGIGRAQILGRWG